MMKSIIIVAVVVFLLSLTACASGQPTVRIAYLPVIQSLPLYMALEKGYFDDANIKVEAVRLDSPNLIIDSLVSGQVDFAMAAATGITAIANYQNPGVIKIFALFGSNYSMTNEVLLVHVNSSLEQISDLRGKRLGILPGIQFRTMAKHILAQHNISIEEVQLVELAPSLQVQALASQQVDAVLSLEPTGIIAREKGIGRDLVSSPLARLIANPWYGGSGVVRAQFARENPQLTAEVIKVIDRAIRDINQNPQAVKKYLVSYTALDAALAEKAPLVIYKMYPDITQVDIDALQKFFDIFTIYGVIDGKVNATEILYS